MIFINSNGFFYEEHKQSKYTNKISKKRKNIFLTKTFPYEHLNDIVIFEGQPTIGEILNSLENQVKNVSLIFKSALKKNKLEDILIELNSKTDYISDFPEHIEASYYIDDTDGVVYDEIDLNAFHNEKLYSLEFVPLWKMRNIQVQANIVYNLHNFDAIDDLSDEELEDMTEEDLHYEISSRGFHGVKFFTLYSFLWGILNQLNLHGELSQKPILFENIKNNEDSDVLYEEYIELLDFSEIGMRHTSKVLNDEEKIKYQITEYEHKLMDLKSKERYEEMSLIRDKIFELQKELKGVQSADKKKKKGKK